MNDIIEIQGHHPPTGSADPTVEGLGGTQNARCARRAPGAGAWRSVVGADLCVRPPTSRRHAHNRGQSGIGRGNRCPTPPTGGIYPAPTGKTAVRNATNGRTQRSAPTSDRAAGGFETLPYNDGGVRWNSQRVSRGLAGHAVPGLATRVRRLRRAELASASGRRSSPYPGPIPRRLRLAK
jgi:hypothetical protein